MLLEFRLRNFRAFRDEATLSLVASSDRTLLDQNTSATDLAYAPRVVRSTAIYGANAGGKTTLLRGLQLMRGVVLESASLKPDQLFNVQPFRLDSASKDKPSLFEVTLLLGGVRHQYGFEFTRSRITSEWLFIYKRNRRQTWINRKFNCISESEEFTFSPHLTGPRKLWQEATRSNALFLSTAVQLNSETLKPLFDWFSSSLNVFLDGGDIPFDFSSGMIERQGGREIIALLNAADIAIQDISVERKKAFQVQVSLNATGEASTKRVEAEVLMPKFTHAALSTKADFNYTEESQGTQKLYALAGPIIDIIKNGRLLVIDELDRSLHALLVRKIIEMFHDPEINQRGAQLLFTTHDTSLLDATLLRRDQIWFSEKNSEQASQLVPLTDFSPRKDEAFEKGYLGGRYGGVPVLDRRLLPSH